MRNKVIFAVLLFVSLNVYGQRNRQAPELAPNVPEWIVGTWVDQNENISTFNANGTMTRPVQYTNRRAILTYKFIIIEDSIFWYEPEANVNFKEVSAYKYYLSDDKRTLLLRFNGNSNSAIWYTKQN